MIGEFFGRIVIRPYEMSATNSDSSNYHTIHTVGDSETLPLR